MASRSLPGCPRRVSAPRGPRSPADPPSRPRVHVPSRGAFAVRTALRAHSPGRWVSLVHCSLRFDTFGRAAVAAFRLSSRLRVTPRPARSPQASPWRHTSGLGRTSPPSAPTRSVSRCPGPHIAPPRRLPLWLGTANPSSLPGPGRLGTGRATLVASWALSCCSSAAARSLTRSNAHRAMRRLRAARPGDGTSVSTGDAGGRWLRGPVTRLQARSCRRPSVTPGAQEVGRGSWPRGSGFRARLGVISPAASPRHLQRESSRAGSTPPRPSHACSAPLGRREARLAVGLAGAGGVAGGAVRGGGSCRCLLGGKEHSLHYPREPARGRRADTTGMDRK